MTASVEVLTVLVTAATVVGTIAPFVLIGLWIADVRGGRLW